MLVLTFSFQTSTLVAPSDGRNITGQAERAAHGNGPVEVSVSGFLTDIDPLVEATSRELGGRFKFNTDYNSGDFVGTCKSMPGATRSATFLTLTILFLAYMQSSIGGGERSSAATAYLPTDVRDRTNLDILLNTRALRLVKTDNSTAGPVFKSVQIAQTASGMYLTPGTSISSDAIFRFPYHPHRQERNHRCWWSLRHSSTSSPLRHWSYRRSRKPLYHSSR